jgi:hypothetical protein
MLPNWEVVRELPHKRKKGGIITPGGVKSSENPGFRLPILLANPKFSYF